MTIQVKTRAKRNAIEDVIRVGDTVALRIVIAASPIDGQANLAIEKLIAHTLGVASSSVSIVRGMSSRIKLVDVDSITVHEVIQSLQTVLSSS